MLGVQTEVVDFQRLCTMPDVQTEVDAQRLCLYDVRRVDRSCGCDFVRCQECRQKLWVFRDFDVLLSLALSNDYLFRQTLGLHTSLEVPSLHFIVFYYLLMEVQQ